MTDPVWKPCTSWKEYQAKAHVGRKVKIIAILTNATTGETIETELSGTTVNMLDPDGLEYLVRLPLDNGFMKVNENNFHHVLFEEMN